MTILWAVLLLGTPGLGAAPKPRAKAPPPSAFSRGLEALSRRDLDKAVALLETAANGESQSAEAYARLGEAHYLRSYARGTQAGPEAAEARRAVTAYETALALDPVFSRVRDPYLLNHGLAMCYSALGRREDALRALRSAISASPDNPMPFLYASRIRFDMQDPARSSQNFVQAVKRSRRLKGYRALTTLVRADPRFSDLMSSPPHRLVLAAYDEVARGKMSEAAALERIQEMASLRDSLRDSPAPLPRRRPEAPRTDPAVQGEIKEGDLSQRSGRLWEAVAHYREALKKDERRGSLTREAKSALLEKLGGAYRRLGLAGEAVRVFDQALEQRPDSASAYFQLSLSYSVLGHYTKSLLCLDRSLKKAASLEELRGLMIQARADPDLLPIRDLAGFRKILLPHARRLSARKA